MKLITKIPYRETKFLYVYSHWDIHLEGICTYNGKICKFITDDSEWYDYLSKFDDENDDVDYDAYTIWCIIYEISFFEKIKLLWRKKLFEVCVGKHWSYDGKKSRSSYYVRKPKWFHNMLFNLYYYKRFTKKKSPATKNISNN